MIGSIVDVENDVPSPRLSFFTLGFDSPYNPIRATPQSLAQAILVLDEERLAVDLDHAPLVAKVVAASAARDLLDAATAGVPHLGRSEVIAGAVADVGGETIGVAWLSSLLEQFAVHHLSNV